jgi:hypothetical protein
MFPLDFGNSTMTVSIALSDAEGAVDSLRRLFEDVGYTGLFDAEYKFDERDGLYKLLEVNTRAWWQIGLWPGCGVALCRLAYRDALGEPVEPVTAYEVGRRWVHDFRDLPAWLGERGRRLNPLRTRDLQPGRQEAFRARGATRCALPALPRATVVAEPRVTSCLPGIQSRAEGFPGLDVCIIGTAVLPGRVFLWSRQPRNKERNVPAAQNTTQVTPTNDAEAGASIRAAPAAAGPLVRRITREATIEMRRRLGLAERARLPDGIKPLIDAAAREIVESALEVAVAREVTGTAERMARASRRGSNDVSTPSDLSLLEAGLNLRSSDFSRPLLERAKALAANKNALEAAGFSREEAMQILVAEVAAGGH